MPSYARFTENYSIGRNIHHADWEKRMEPTHRLQELALYRRRLSSASEKEARAANDRKQAEQARSLAELRAELIAGPTASEYDRQFHPEEFAANAAPENQPELLC